MRMRVLFGGGKRQHKYDDSERTALSVGKVTDGGSFNKLEDQVALKDESACVIHSPYIHQIPLKSKPTKACCSVAGSPLMYKNNMCVFTLSKCEAGIVVTRKDRDGYFYVLFATVSTLLFRNLMFHRSAFLIILIQKSLPHRNTLATHGPSGWKIFGVGSVAFLVGICCQQNYIWP